jgi:hypothetical protein
MKYTGGIFSLTLIFGASLVIASTAHIQPAQATVACSSSAATQNGIKVVPSHGSVFYIDTGVTPKLDAGYIGYRVSNQSGSAYPHLWTQVSSFSSNVLSLNNSADSMMQLPSLANGATGTSYFMLKATTATTTAQTHTVRVYTDRPDLASASLLYECQFSFTKVQETIKAAANKLVNNGLTTSTAIEVSDTTPELGQTVTISVEGETGQIGSGSSPDFDMVWLTPAAVSSWPTRSLRLESVSVTFDANKNWANTGDEVTYNDQLLIQSVDGTNVDSSAYRAYYTFRVIGRPQSTIKAVPVAQISSGTQVKHTDTTASGATVDISFSSLAINASLLKTVTTTTGLTVVTCGGSCSVPSGVNGQTYVSVPYQLKATASTVTNVTIDDFIDTPGSGVIFKPSSAMISDIGRTNVSLSDPVYLASEASNNPRPYHFVGPFTLNSATSATLTYNMWVPVGSYLNYAYGKLGDVLIGATASSMSQVNVTSNGTASITAVTSTTSLPISITTDSPTNVSSTTVTLNGTVDPNGITPLTGTFEYSTSADLTNSITATATTPTNGTLGLLTDPTAISVNLTGLSSGTTYYYRAVAGTATGTIVSFTTLSVQTTPTVTTQAATSIALTSATLNGTINPNLTPLTGIQFIYGTNATLSSGNTTSTQDDGTGTGPLTANGSSPQAFTQAITGLTGGTTYYFKIRACTSALTGTYPSVSCASFVDGSIMSFVASTAPTIVTSAATSVGASVATLNGTLNAHFATSTASFTYSTVSDLSSGTSTASAGTVTGSTSSSISAAITGLTPSTTYYFRAVGTNDQGTVNGSILSFTTLSVNRTLTIDAASYNASYAYTASAPTLTATPSAGTGAITFTSETTDVCTVNASSGLVTFLTIGTCTIHATIAANASYSDATSPSISFEILAVSRTLTIDGGSYNASYVYTATPPTITATPSAGTGTKTFTSLTTSVCTINASSGLVAFVNLGTCTIDATISASGNYLSADADSVSFEVTVVPRTLTIDSASYVSSYNISETPPTLTATPSAGTGTITFTESTPSVCTVNSSSGVVTFVDVGTCIIGANINANGVYNSATASEISFEISNSVLAPNLTTDAATSVATSTATLNGTITSTGGDPITVRGFEYGVSTTYGTTTTHLGSFGISSFSDALTGLAPGTTYHFRAYAVNGAGLSYGDDLTFATPLISRTLSINPESYTASYVYTSSTPTIIATPTAGTGTITYTSETTGVCTINSSSGVVTFTGLGTCTIGASIASDGTYSAATATSISFQVTSVARTLTIDPESYESTYIFNDSPPTLIATPSAGSGSITFTSLTTGVCAVNSSSGVVTFTDLGTCTVSSTISAFGVYAGAVSDSISFTITPISRTLTIDPESFNESYVYSATPPTITATPSAGTGTITFISEDLAVCTINTSSGLVNFVNLGSCLIHAYIPANGVYNEATADTISFEVTVISRTLTIDPESYSSSYSFNETPPTLTATPSAGTGTITFTESTPSVCTINAASGLVAFSSTGTCIFGANISVDDVYNSAVADTISFTVSEALLLPSVTTNAASSVATSTATLNGNIVSTGGVNATIRGFVLGLTTAYGTTSSVSGDFGTGTFTANLTDLTPGATYHYRAFATNTQGTNYGNDISFTLTTLTRTLTIDEESFQGNYALDADPPTITATPSAGTGTITFTSETTDVCTIDESTGQVTFLGLGTCTIHAHITANGIYDQATSESISFSVTSVSRTLTIDPESYSSSYSLSENAPIITATPSAGSGTITFNGATTDVCTIDESTGQVTFVTTGTCTIGAHISANGVYGSAFAEEISFTVTAALLAPSVTTNAASSVTTSTASLNGNIVSTGGVSPTTRGFAYGLTTAYGTTTTQSGTFSTGSFTASLSSLTPGSTYHYRAFAENTQGLSYGSDVTFTVPVLTRTLTIDPESFESTYIFSSMPPTINATPSAGSGSITYTSLTTDVCVVNATSGLVTFYSLGTCTLSSSISANGQYGSANSSNISFTITASARTLTIDQSSYLPSYIRTEAPPTITSTPSAGTGSKTYTSLTTSTCLVNSSTGLVSFTGSGTCSIGATISASGTYAFATANNISFIINAVNVPSIGGGGGSPITIVTSSPVVPIITTTPVSTTPVVTSPPAPPTIPAAPGTPASPATPSASPASHQTDGCPVDCKSLSWDLYIVNPDGTERHRGTRYVRTEKLADGRTLVRFEDSGKDFDYNDITIIVDDRVCGNWTFQVSQKNARWNHRVMLNVSHKGHLIETRELWSNSGSAVGVQKSVDASSLKDVCIKPVNIDCTRISLTPYIILPNGTVRRAGTRYVREKKLGVNQVQYEFEDKGDDFDYNDFIMTVDKSTCSATVAAGKVDARWHHEVHVEVELDGKKANDVLLWKDSHQSNKGTHTFDATAGLNASSQTIHACRIEGIVQGTKLGDNGPQVNALQDFLKCASFMPQDILSNGNFGPSTLQALQNFQTSKGLIPVTGAVGPRTFQAIQEYK